MIGILAGIGAILMYIGFGIGVGGLYLMAQRNLIIGYEARQALIDLGFRAKVKNLYPNEPSVSQDLEESLKRAEEVMNKEYKWNVAWNYKFVKPEFKPPKIMEKVQNE